MGLAVFGNDMLNVIGGIGGSDTGLVALMPDRGVDEDAGVEAALLDPPVPPDDVGPLGEPESLGDASVLGGAVAVDETHPLTPRPPP
jgi:hypothetical protein